ncbi:site-2 protease family protein [Spongiactinospora sp. TRM90649]|uniref:M50 family metallopeptidase n=1 Tax=Spongiactinospora sp. TRM90649 TaxID=3031114 RepID=UPI0023F9D660|nr:site-2 protease family protein [Spongiactinospora sp. TRM90649]MDF5758725.1 site-2 protease family protein [Spongiactinospora sp. TRM90649]
MELWLNIAGILIFLVGLMVSIALHEIGHLVPAKRFGVRVPQYMVGFGATMWSRRKGETEYGIKWIPMGGYVRMIGMLPPRPNDDPNTLRGTTTGMFQGLVDSAREASLEEIRPGDEKRVFYRKAWWQKAIIMTGGPAMNFVLAFLLYAVLLMGFGVATYHTVVNTVPACVKTAAEFQRNSACGPGDQASPAAKAGLRPGDKILSVDGKQVADWDAASRAIRAAGGGQVAIGIERDGRPLALNAELIPQDRQSLDDPNKIDKGVGYLGVTPVVTMEPQGIGAVGAHMVDVTRATAASLVRLPEKMVGVWDAAFSGEKRDPNGPIGIVGAGRIGGEIVASDAPVRDKIVFFVNLLAGFNLAIGMFNLLPLLPLDGGHIVGALWEGVKRGFARLFRRPTPGYVDIAKLLPLTYGVAMVMIVMAGLLAYADLVNPIRLSG